MTLSVYLYMLVSWISFGISVAGWGLAGSWLETAIGEVLVLCKCLGDRVWGGGRLESNEPGRE